MIYNTRLHFETDKKCIVADDMLLTKDEIRTTAGSAMLDDYKSLFEAEALTRLEKAGFALTGKASVGEFAIDLLGETAYNGANVKDGVFVNASAEILKAGEAIASVGLKELVEMKCCNETNIRVLIGLQEAIKTNKVCSFLSGVIQDSIQG